ncbi:hypothetical protein POM88_007919 [Heracleum sosnowskyi]|uniref:Uncharacterized protein n=1 Tax=Heracleum sosnowskyi TaxID=360622 RepID=A0AAD8N6W5_9APIA|nr:hypothetical protein POM88_007919 [Heracleum sosnowskyi]
MGLSTILVLWSQLFNLHNKKPKIFSGSRLLYKQAFKQEKILISSKIRIDCPMALRTLLAIMCMFWPDGWVGALEIDRKYPGFWIKCINEFLRYYTYDPRFDTKAEIAGASGTTYADHRPLFMKPGVWSRLAQYWVIEEFKKKSAAGKKARQAVKVPHTSSARSFDRRRRDYMEARDGKLDELAVYKECHTLKDEERKGEWITEDAHKIIWKYEVRRNESLALFSSLLLGGHEILKCTKIVITGSCCKLHQGWRTDQLAGLF